MNKKKEEWLELISEQGEAYLAKGGALNDLNANKIIDALATRSRTSVYKYFPVWVASKVQAAPLPPSVLDSDNANKFVSTITEMLGEVVKNDRQAAADLVAAADQRVNAAKNERLGLLESLEATEVERDNLEEQLQAAKSKIDDLHRWGLTQQELASTFRAERDEILKRYMQPPPSPPAFDHALASDAPTKV